LVDFLDNYPFGARRIEMFATRGQKLLLIILVMVAALSVMASWLLFKPEAGTALAQGGGEGDKKTDNYEAWQEAVKSRDPSASTAFVALPEGGDIGPQSDGSGVEVLSMGAFKNDGDSVDSWFNYFLGGYFRNDGDEVACFMAPTYPPNGAALTQVRISILDQSASSDILFAELKRVKLTTGVVDYMSGGDVPWNDPSPVELMAGIVPGTEVVSNDYAYYFHLCFPPSSGVDVLFYGARLFYAP
jgi:hypothetical protein